MDLYIIVHHFVGNLCPASNSFLQLVTDDVLMCSLSDTGQTVTSLCTVYSYTQMVEFTLSVL